MGKKAMTIQEFNDNYRIAVLFEASSDAELNSRGDHELMYGPIRTTHENIDYVVYDKKGNEVFVSSATSDINFLQDLVKEFDITDLTL